MKLEDCIAQSAKKIVKINKANGSEIGVFKDTKEGVTFYCTAWMEKGRMPKFKFFADIDNAMALLETVNEVIS